MSARFRSILLLSAILKVSLALAFADLKPRYDEVEFLEFGRKVLDGAAPVLWRAPGYQWFVAAGLALAGGRPVGVRVLEALVSCGISILAYRIARARWGESAGIVAGTFTALAPSSVAFSHLLWSESLYSFLVLLAFGLLLRADAGERSLLAFLAGAVLGCAALTRSVGLVLVAVSMLWSCAAGLDRRRLALAGALAGGALLAVLPYALWASARAGRVVVIDTNSGFNLWSGNNEYIPRDLPSLWTAGLPLENGTSLPLPDGEWRGLVPTLMEKEGIGPGDTDAWYRDRALRYLRGHPLDAVLRVPSKAAAFWSPDFFLPRHLLRDWYGPVPPVVASLLVLLAFATAAVPLVLGPACLAVLPGDRFRSLALAWVLSYLAVHVIAYGHARMHEPLVAILVLAVAGCCAGGGSAVAARLRRGLPWIGLALASWVLLWPVVAGVYLMPGPRHAALARVLASVRRLPLPGAHRLAWMLAGVEEARGRYDEAERILSEEKVGSLPWSLVLRGTIEERRGLLRDAEARFSRALEANPPLYEAALGLGRVRLALGDTAGALEPLRRAAEMRPWDPAPQALLSRVGAAR